MRIWVVFLCLLFFSSCGKKEASKPEDHQLKTIKVMTYNIRHGDPKGKSDINLASIAAVINKQKPDLVALQEVDVNTRRAPVNEVEVLAKATGMHGYFSKSFNYQGGEYGNAVLSRFPIIDSVHFYLPNPNPTGNIQSVGIVTVEIANGIKMRFAATHFDLIQENRIAQAKKLVKISKSSNLPMAIAGDLNATPDAKEIKALEEEYTPGCMIKCPHTFSANNPKITIDYIMLNSIANQKLSFLSYNAIGGVYASDHLPLIALLSINK